MLVSRPAAAIRGAARKRAAPGRVAGGRLLRTRRRDALHMSDGVPGTDRGEGLVGR